MSDPDLAKVRVWLLCRGCRAEREVEVPRIALAWKGRFSVKLHCETCKGPRAFAVNPLKLPAEDA